MHRESELHSPGEEDARRDVMEPPDPARHHGRPVVAPNLSRNEIRLAAERAGRPWEQPETD